MTRGMLALATGDLSRAVAFHPLAPLAAIEAFLAWALWGCQAFGLLRRAETPWVRLAVGHAILLGGVWVARVLTHTLPG